jgi:hypothetical protein
VAPVLERPQTTGVPMDYVPRYFLKSSMSPFPGVLMRRRVALNIGGFDERWGPIADYEFWYRLACAGRVEVVGAIGAFYRVAPGQWTERIWKRMLRLTHLLRIRIAKEQFPESPRLGRWAARFFTFRNARCYGKRFGAGSPALSRCLRLGTMPFAQLPSGWIWQALKFASRLKWRHSRVQPDVGRTTQIQQDRGGSGRLVQEDSLRGPDQGAQEAFASARGPDRRDSHEAWDRHSHQGTGDPRQVA